MPWAESTAWSPLPARPAPERGGKAQHQPQQPQRKGALSVWGCRTSCNPCHSKRAAHSMLFLAAGTGVGSAEPTMLPMRPCPTWVVAAVLHRLLLLLRGEELELRGAQQQAHCALAGRVCGQHNAVVAAPASHGHPPRTCLSSDDMGPGGSLPWLSPWRISSGRSEGFWSSSRASLVPITR